MNHLVNGAPTEVPPDATAFPWRNFSFSLSVAAGVPLLSQGWDAAAASGNGAGIANATKACAAVGDALLAALDPFLPGGADANLYINYPVRGAAARAAAVLMQLSLGRRAWRRSPLAPASWLQWCLVAPGRPAVDPLAPDPPLPLLPCCAALAAHPSERRVRLAGGLLRRQLPAPAGRACGL